MYHRWYWEISGSMAMNVGQSFGEKGGQYQGKQFQFKGRKTKEERMQLYCPHCQRHGHEEKECFKLHGYPEWYKEFKKAKGKPRANFADSHSQAEKMPIAGVESSSSTPDFSKMMQAEFAKYMSNYVGKNGGSSSHTQADVNMIHRGSHEEFNDHYAFSILKGHRQNHWILDSGASAHICCNPDLLSSVTKLPAQQDIYLPDGSVQQVFHCVTTSINGAITLNNVLLTPSFTHNLVSVAQLARDSSARIMFLSTHCLIQKDGNDHVLGIAKERGNLYVINTSDS